MLKIEIPRLQLLYRKFNSKRKENKMSVDFKTFLNIVPHVVDIKKPVLLRGRHGIGKSEIVYQFAEAKELPVVERRASQMTEGDLLGLPSVEGGVTAWCAPDWLHRACTEPVILFLDEVDRATSEVRQGIFELTDSRKISGNVLHPDTLIFAAVNGGEHGSQYQVGEMDPAELDRWTVFDLEPSVEDWLNWPRITWSPSCGTSSTTTVSTLSTRASSSPTRYILLVALGSGPTTALRWLA